MGNNYKKHYNDFIKENKKRFSSGRYLIEQSVIMILNKLTTEEATFLNSYDRQNYYDAYFPSGFPQKNINKPVLIEIKLADKIDPARNVIDDLIGVIQTKDNGIGELKIIFVFPCLKKSNIEKIRVYTEKANEKYNYDITIWSKDELLDIIEENSFDIYDSFGSEIIKQRIKNTDKYTIEQESKDNLQQLKGYYSKGEKELVWFLGAGVSIPYNSPPWYTLIRELHAKFYNEIIKLFEKENIEKKFIRFEDNTEISKLINQIEQQYVLTAGNDLNIEYLTEERLTTKVKEVLEARISDPKTEDTPTILQAIAEMENIKNIVTYNYDDLLEMELDKAHKNYTVFQKDIDNWDVVNDGLNIYHVHGFLNICAKHKPAFKSDKEIVFTEQSYHTLYNSDNLSNKKQEEFFLSDDHICVFVGSSLTDPNIRRLLQKSYDCKNEQNDENQNSIYAFIKIEDNYLGDNKIGTDSLLKTLKTINFAKKREEFRMLGINVIWVKDFNDIPKYIREISAIAQ